MSLRNTHNFMFFFGWNRFSGFGYLGMEKSAGRIG